MASSAMTTGHAFLGSLVALTVPAAYSCGTYGAGGYGTSCSTNTTVGVPNTGFAPLDALQTAVSGNPLLAFVGALLILLSAVGGVVMWRRRRRTR
jgi:LPXTG-motif cell wall-anchored protein